MTDDIKAAVERLRQRAHVAIWRFIQNQPVDYDDYYHFEAVENYRLAHDILAALPPEGWVMVKRPSPLGTGVKAGDAVMVEGRAVTDPINDYQGLYYVMVEFKCSDGPPMKCPVYVENIAAAKGTGQ